MNFEWDDAKRAFNLRKHGLAFEDAVLVFASDHFRREARAVGGEQRWLVVGPLRDVMVALVFVPRGDAVRIISMRRARDGERREDYAAGGL